MRPTVLAACLAAFALLGLQVAPLVAQSRGTSALRGTVLTSDGAPRAGVEVRLVQTETGIEKRSLTNAEGRFLFLLLPPGGPYTLSAGALGFAEERREGLTLEVGEIETVELVLREEALAIEGIDVDVSRVRVFDPSRVGPATVLDERLVESLPVLSRDLMEMSVLSPLVTTTDGGGFSVAGQNDRYNAILIDGVPGKDMFGLTAGGVPGGQAGAKLIPIDAVAQYEILVAPFDVRLSGFTGGVMNALTRTGTNRWQVRVQGVHRNEKLMGDLRLPVGSAEASGVDRSLAALSVGGPILRNEAHFFVAGEIERRRQPPIGYNVGRDDPFLPRLTLASANQARDRFESRFGLDPGEVGAYPLTQTLTNLFARVDWRLSDRHRLTVRDIVAVAGNDESPNRLGFQPYGYASNAVRRESTSHILSGQLFSDIGRSASNELSAHIMWGGDRSDPVSDWPQVQVNLLSDADTVTLQRDVRFGSAFLAQDADLSQMQARLTNTLSLVRGSSTYMLGLTGSLYRIAHRYLPGARGEWLYEGIEQLESDDPARVQWAELAAGEEPAIRFSVLEWGAFVQNEMSVADRLTMRFGLRVDVPHVLGSPETNLDVLNFFGYDTGSLPSANFLVSPRWGFNWQSGSAHRTQVRGGLGLFTGQLPFVWLSNAFHDDGMRSTTYVCAGRPSLGGAAPHFETSVADLACAGDQTPRVVRNVTVFHPAFKYPRDLKFSAIVDRELTDRISGSFGVLFNRAINQVVLEEMNLGEPSQNLGPLEAFGESEREYYGRRGGSGGAVFVPNPLDPEHDRVLLATNESEDVAFAVTLEVRGRIADRLAFQGGYTFSRALDKMSLVSTDFVSNFGLNPVDRNPNRPSLRPSNFDRPHKVVASVYGAPFPGLQDTQISLLYTGQSGYPFSYVYGFDVNGDGYPGPGAAFERTNDLVYVPSRLSDVEAGFATYALLSRALEDDACLRAWEGRIMRRNACRSPWQHRLDLRVTQGIEIGNARIRLEADLVNVLNLLADGSGQIETVRVATPLLNAVGRQTSCPPTGCEVVFRWAGASFRDAAGALRPTEPWYAVSPDSQWQLQIGARVGFGGVPR